MDVGRAVARWQEWFPSCPPIRHLLRRRFPERWLRVHSLPDAQRLATSDEERRELLRRHNAVATAILGEGAPVEVVVTYANGYLGEDEPASVTSLGAGIAADWAHAWASSGEYLDELEDTVFALGEIFWRSGEFDSLIEDAAAARTAPLLLVATGTGRVYSPYDGGADLFAQDEWERRALRAQFESWVSARPDGL